MQGIFFEPSGYFDDKLKRRDRKKEALANSKRELHISSSARSTPKPSRRSSARHYKSKMYQANSSHTSLSNQYRKNKPTNHRRKNLDTNSMSDDVFEAYKKKLKRKKANRSRSMNSNGVQTLLSIEKNRITKDKFSRLFHDFEATQAIIDKSERDQLFRSKISTLNQEKKKNKPIAYELINQYFSSILDGKYSQHPLARLITKFCNLFHGQYSFSPQDFKNKSIYQIIDQKRMKRKGNKRTANDIFDDNLNRNQSKVVRKTSRRLDRAILDVKNFIKKLRALILALYPELKALRPYKYVVQSVFHKELFVQLTPTLGDLYSVKTEAKQCEFAKYMGMWQNLTCKDFGASTEFVDFCLIPSLRPTLLNENEEHKQFEPQQTHCLTEEALKQFDANYAISQLLNHSEEIQQCETNFAVPEFVNGYNTDLEDDESITSFCDNASIASYASSIHSSPDSFKKNKMKMQRSYSLEYKTSKAIKVNTSRAAVRTHKTSFKHNIENITKQMLAGSHAERIANQLHRDKEVKITPKAKINNDEYNPYISAVLEIKKMPQFDTPEDKIQCVVRTADIIRDCIDQYYENRRIEPIQITPSDLLSLFAFILVKANLHCLWTEVDLIDDFVVDNLRMDMCGYYLATLRAAMQLIVNDIDKLTQTSLKKSRSSFKLNDNITTL